MVQHTGPHLRLLPSRTDPQGLLHQKWTVRVECLPFGLRNAPATFQQLMDHFLAGMQWETCLIYLDDIIVSNAGAAGPGFQPTPPGQPETETC